MLNTMFSIQNKQLEAFKDLALKKFEDEMVEHIKEFFPSHYIMIQEIAIRNTIRFGYLRAKNHGFSTKRNVCLYINNMMILGSHFDYDPQYPWANFILKDDSERHPIIRIDKLCDKTLDVFDQLLGRRQLFINRALLNLHNNADLILQMLRSSDLTGAFQHLRIIFPEKYDVIGEFNLSQMINYGFDQANTYGITSQSSILIYIVCMFLLGSDFDKDPQFPWARKILNDFTVKDKNEKAELLYRTGVDNLNSFFVRNNH